MLAELKVAVVVDADQVAVATLHMKTMKKMNTNAAEAEHQAINMVTMDAVAVEVVDRTNYIAKSRASIEALKSANLLKSVSINALILGEKGVGKETLARHIMDAPLVEASFFNELLALIETNASVIVKNFHLITNYKKLKIALETHKTRIIATSSTPLSEALMDEFFSLKITIPPLREREEDVMPLIEKFAFEAYGMFGESSNASFSYQEVIPDLTQNCYSLRRSVYNAYLMNTFGEKEILSMMEQFLSHRIGGRNDYRDLLYLFDVPLIKSGHAKFGSQLAMSEKFGLNRNTLRKKINDYKDKLDFE